ncbi:hypothetical protein C2G38_2218377 [Gigaspora rosea]|uniref:Uncharacterized protein n=1 Tax=Gigaspora rosea TaxID=44941 RepID=A0A397UAY1_9GLOM|nr:hypothetical protein C2G38_2218377 [Gigaspora rosea]
MGQKGKSLTRQYPIIIGLGNKQSSKASGDNKQSFSNLSFCLPEISFSDIHTKVNYRKAYVIANGLSKKAIQIGLDAGSSAIQELEDLINSLITKYALKKRKKLVNKKNIEQQEDKDKVISNSSSSDEDFVAVENPIGHSRRDASRKKRFKESHEVESNKSKRNLEAQKTRKPTQYQQCQNTGHNKTGCETWHKRQGIPYSY